MVWLLVIDNGGLVGCWESLSRGNPDRGGRVDGLDNILNDGLDHDIFLLQGKGRDEGQDGGEHADADGFHFLLKIC